MTDLHLIDSSRDEEYQVSREHVLELELWAERVRRAEAELALVKTRHQVVTANISAVYSERDAFELIGELSATGVGRRRRRPTDGGSHG